MHGTNLNLLPMQFTLDTDYIEMVKLLKLTGLCESGGAAKMAIAAGLVEYNGKVDYRKRLKVRKGDRVEFDEKTIEIV